jgi:predicted DNA-binding transcriptional regulator AlpA
MAKHYLTRKQVLERYGNRSPMWLWRLLKRDASFPRPINLAGSTPLFDADELDAYDAQCKAQRDDTHAAA